MTRIIMISAMALLLASCKSSKELPALTPDISYAPAMLGGKPSMMMPKAVAYKTNGDYNDHVAVVVNDAGTSLITYPAPTDVNVNSAPLSLGDGWLLDRRGTIGLNTRFLRYTYAEYSKLKAAPSVEQLMSAIIPDARVTECKILPMTLDEALQQPQKAKAALK